VAQSASVTQHIAFETVHTGPVRGTGLSPATCGRHMSANTVKGDKLMNMTEWQSLEITKTTTEKWMNATVQKDEIRKTHHEKVM